MTEILERKSKEKQRICPDKGTNLCFFHINLIPSISGSPKSKRIISGHWEVMMESPSAPVTASLHPSDTPLLCLKSSLLYQDIKLVKWNTCWLYLSSLSLMLIHPFFLFYSTEIEYKINSTTNYYDCSNNTS